MGMVTDKLREWADTYYNRGEDTDDRSGRGGKWFQNALFIPTDRYSGRNN